MCTDQRRAIFADHDFVERLRTQLLRTSEERGFALLAYTFMPDHLHLLVEGRFDDSDLIKFATAFRRRASNECGLTVRPLWQDGYHDQVLRGADQTARVIDYILNNPVRAGLVERATDYPASWSVTLAAALETTPPSRK